MTGFHDGRIDPDPYPNFAWLRDHQPVCPLPVADGEPAAWMLSRYGDVRAALMDERLSSDRRNWAGHRDDPAAALTSTDHMNAIVGLDPPRQTRLRKLAAGAFQARRVERMRPRVRAIADELIDGFATLGRADLVAGLTFPMPARVIGELIGVPPDSLATMGEWSDLVARSAAEGEQVSADAVAQVEAYLATIVERKRGQLADDLLSDLIRAVDGGALMPVELTAMIFVVIGAGHIPTLHYLGGIAFRALTDDRIRRAFLGDDTLLRTAIDELARIDSATQLLNTRYARTDLVVAGQRIARGESVVLAIGAANRDPAQFGDPDEIMPTRPRDQHLAFGHGPHFCLGAPLARIEAEEAIAALLSRLPDIALDAPARALPWHGGPYRRGPRQLPVTFTPEPGRDPASRSNTGTGHPNAGHPYTETSASTPGGGTHG